MAVQRPAHQMAAGDMRQLMANDRLQHADGFQPCYQTVIQENRAAIDHERVQVLVVYDQHFNLARTDACGLEQRLRNAAQGLFNLSVADQALGQCALAQRQAQQQADHHPRWPRGKSGQVAGAH